MHGFRAMSKLSVKNNTAYTITYLEEGTAYHDIRVHDFSTDMLWLILHYTRSTYLIYTNHYWGWHTSLEWQPMSDTYKGMHICEVVTRNYTFNEDTVQSLQGEFLQQPQDQYDTSSVRCCHWWLDWVSCWTKVGLGIAGRTLQPSTLLTIPEEIIWVEGSRWYL